MKVVRGLIAFWYDFIVGDDWRVAVAVVCGLAVTALLVRHAVNVWWLVPLVALLALLGSVLSAARRAK